MIKNNKKQLASLQQNRWVLLAMGLVFAGIVYAAFSWGLDSGRPVAYAIFAATMYMAVHYLKLSLKQFIRK